MNTPFIASHVARLETIRDAALALRTPESSDIAGALTDLSQDFLLAVYRAAGSEADAVSAEITAAMPAAKAQARAELAGDDVDLAHLAAVVQTMPVFAVGVLHRDSRDRRIRRARRAARAAGGDADVVNKAGRDAVLLAG